MDIEQIYNEVIFVLRKLTNSINRSNQSQVERVYKHLAWVKSKTESTIENKYIPTNLTNNTIEEMNLALKSIKGEITRDLSDDEAKNYIKWIIKLLKDTISHNKDLVLISELRNARATNNQNLVKIIKKKRKKYIPEKYPASLKIGDIIYVQCGFGYCGEINTNHYGIIMSEMKNQMFFVVPLSSDPLRIFSFSFKGLNLPNADGDGDKESFVRFDQAKFIHYRRLENIEVNGSILKRYLNDSQIVILNKKFLDFMNFKLTSE